MRKAGIENRKVKKENGMMTVSNMDFLPQSEESSVQPSVQCMFCNVTCRNQSLVPSKLRHHLKNKHSIHQNKSKQYFKKQHDFFGKQKIALQLLATNNYGNKNALLLSSFQIAHVLMQQTKLYTETELVINSCLKIVANLLHDGKNASEKVQQIPLSSDIMNV